eukprot:15445001-Alexandrium_andersonii.AAC.1
MTAPRDISALPSRVQEESHRYPLRSRVGAQGGSPLTQALIDRNPCRRRRCGCWLLVVWLPVVGCWLLAAG